MSSNTPAVAVSLLASLVALAALVACTAETTSVAGPAPAASSTGTNTPDAPAAAPDAGSTKPDVRDAAANAPAVAAWTPGESGKSCADACQAAGKTCAVECKDQPSCGAHDNEPPPYAGYACYYRESNSSRSNDGRSLLTCDEVATVTWKRFGLEYTIGDYLGGNPVSCCCR